MQHKYKMLVSQKHNSTVYLKWFKVHVAMVLENKEQKTKTLLNEFLLSVTFMNQNKTWDKIFFAFWKNRSTLEKKTPTQLLTICAR